MKKKNIKKLIKYQYQARKRKKKNSSKIEANHRSRGKNQGQAWANQTIGFKINIDAENIEPKPKKHRRSKALKIKQAGLVKQARSSLEKSDKAKGNKRKNLKKMVDRSFAYGANRKELSDITRDNNLVVGVFRQALWGGAVDITSGSIKGTIRISSKDFNGAPFGTLVSARLMLPINPLTPRGAIEEVLGLPSITDASMQGIFTAHGVDLEFPQEVISEAKSFGKELTPPMIKSELQKGRHDLRHLPTLTIDGIDAKDLDDALSIEALPKGGYRLYVHIADVSNYVIENSALDIEAAKRTTSIYPVDRVIPMLPTALSNGLCSLNPHQDRLALTVEIEFNVRGRRLSGKVYESLIRSDLRADYHTVYECLTTKVVPETYKEMYPYLEQMAKLANKLTKQRMRRGYLDFNFPETKVELDANGKPLRIYAYETNFANLLIEEFMVAANEWVAEHFANLKAPFIYRVHDLPNAEKLENLEKVCQRLGIESKLSPQPTTIEVAALLNEINSLPQGDTMAQLLLRSMAKAEYEADCKGHFGLAAPYYCHFTSPIRRYPDLFIHRVIKGYIHGKIHASRWQKKAVKMSGRCSEQERVAMLVERETKDLKIAEFMSEHIGSIYKGRISGFNNAGFFVRLENTAEGMVPYRVLPRYYNYDENNMEARSETGNRILHIGDELEIRVVSADYVVRRIDFEPVDLKKF